MTNAYKWFKRVMRILAAVELVVGIIMIFM